MKIQEYVCETAPQSVEFTDEAIALIEKLGAAEAPHVAAFYLTHNDPFYVKKRHPPNLLVLDATGLRTQWATGVKATSSEVRQAEMKDDSREQVKRVEAILARGM